MHMRFGIFVRLREGEVTYYSEGSHACYLLASLVNKVDTFAASVEAHPEACLQRLGYRTEPLHCLLELLRRLVKLLLLHHCIDCHYVRMQLAEQSRQDKAWRGVC